MLSAQISVFPACSVLNVSALGKGTDRTRLSWRCPSPSQDKQGPHKLSPGSESIIDTKILHWIWIHSSITCLQTSQSNISDFGAGRTKVSFHPWWIFFSPGLGSCSQRTQSHALWGGSRVRKAGCSQSTNLSPAVHVDAGDLTSAPSGGFWRCRRGTEAIIQATAVFSHTVVAFQAVWLHSPGASQQQAEASPFDIRYPKVSVVA